MNCVMIRKFLLFYYACILILRLLFKTFNRIFFKPGYISLVKTKTNFIFGGYTSKSHKEIPDENFDTRWRDFKSFVFLFYVPNVYKNKKIWNWIKNYPKVWKASFKGGWVSTRQTQGPNFGRGRCIEIKNINNIVVLIYSFPQGAINFQSLSG